MRARNLIVTGGGILLARAGAILALAGVLAAAAAAALSATPSGAHKLDAPGPALSGRRVPQVRAVGLDHAGGDLKRSVRVTRRTSRNRAAQRMSWAGVALIIPRQATAVTASLA
ncbi:MAG TPA: hypothetical protein VF162_14805 [Streptosporangiaceae bacterium]